MVLGILAGIIFHWFVFYCLIVPVAIALGVKYRIKYSRCKHDITNEIDVSEKVVIVTGASDGIGKITAQEMAIRGAKVIMACRNVKKAEKALQDIRRATQNGELIIMELDLSSLSSIHKFVSEFISKFGGPSSDGLSILINNAGVANLPGERKLTADGFEQCFGVNHLGHFLLTNLLLPELERAGEKSSTASRIVTVASGVHSMGHLNFNDLMYEKTPLQNDTTIPAKFYCNSKLANMHFNVELGKRLRGKGVHVNSYVVCPGLVPTNLGGDDAMEKLTFLQRNVTFPVMKFVIGKDLKEGAETTLHCSLSKYLEHHNGEAYQNAEFWDQGRRPTLTEEDSSKLWEISEKLVKL